MTCEMPVSLERKITITCTCVYYSDILYISVGLLTQEILICNPLRVNILMYSSLKTGQG